MPGSTGPTRWSPPRATDAVNLMTCWLAKRYNVRNVVSIVNQKEHSDLFNEVGVKISENPDELVATRLYYWARSPNLQQVASIPGGTIFEIVAEAGAPIVDRGDPGTRCPGLRLHRYTACRRGPDHTERRGPYQTGGRHYGLYEKRG